MSKISTKNILKKIFKSKTEKKVKKKVAKKVIKKVVKPKKVKKVAKKIAPKKTKKIIKKTSSKITKIKKVSKKNEIQEEAKVDNLRISKSNEVKPEIKKVKKQETEKREYKIKDHVVYPKHGVGQITEFKKINIGGIDVETYVIKFEKDKANGMVPVNKQSHLRPLATINQVNKCISILKSKPKIKRSMWSRRAQEYEAKISSGKIYELAEVVRDLNKGDDLMVDQSYSERQLFEKAYERILSEFQIVLNVLLLSAGLAYGVGSFAKGAGFGPQGTEAGTYGASTGASNVANVSGPEIMSGVNTTVPVSQVASSIPSTASNAISSVFDFAKANPLLTATGIGALALAGGYLQGSDLKNVKLYSIDGENKNINLNNLESINNLIKLKPHDTVFIEEKRMSKFFLSSNLPYIIISLLNLAVTLDKN